jgi:hypothetical protein
MQWSQLFLVVLVMIVTSFSLKDQPTEIPAIADTDQPLHNPDIIKQGWELHAPKADAVAVATKTMLRSAYPAGSLLHDDKAPGGFAPCDNYPFKLGAKDWGTKGKVSLVAFPEEKIDYDGHQGIALRLINRSEKIRVFAAVDSLLYIHQEAQDEIGFWREIEFRPDLGTSCGNSFHRVLLSPGQYWQFAAPLYQGSFKTKIRCRLDPTGQPRFASTIYSNEFEGFVDPRQFQPAP